MIYSSVQYLWVTDSKISFTDPLSLAPGPELAARATPGNYIPPLAFGHGFPADLHSHPPSTAGSIEHPALDFSSIEGLYL